MASRLGLRRALVRMQEAVVDWTVAAREDLLPIHALDLFHFRTQADVDAFQVTTDKVLGGRTDATFTLKQYNHFNAGLFQGSINFQDDNPASRGGFASFRTKPSERARDLSAFEAFELRIKTDGRPYVLNVKCEEHPADLLWQVRIVTEPFRWVTVACPFSDLVLTRRGRVELNQLPLSRESVNGWGILLADGMNGPFKFEVQHVRALRDFDPAVYANESAQQLAASQRRQLQPRTSNSVQSASSSATTATSTTASTSATAAAEHATTAAAAAPGQQAVTSGPASTPADAIAENLGAVRDKEYYRLLREKARLV